MLQISLAKQSHGLSHMSKDIKQPGLCRSQQVFSDNGRLTKRIRFRLESRALTYSTFSIEV